MKKPDITHKNIHKTKRHLPHWQVGGSWYFITFRVKGDIQLTPTAKDALLKVISNDNGNRYELSIAVVMPDHVHILLRPKEKV